MKMKKGLKMALALTLATGLFVGCGASNSGSSSDSNGATESDTIKIGVNYELSGGVATYGQSSVAGIELAIKEINAAGGVDGKQVELVKYDNKSEPSEATTLSNKLMTQDKVLTILGPATSGSFKATIPVAMQNSVPVISGSATADDVTVDASGVKDYAFRICFSDSYQGNAMARFAYDNLQMSKAVLITDNSSDYGKGLSANFQKTFAEIGGTIVAEEAYVAGDTDFNSILTKIRGQEFDVIYIPGYYQEAGLIIKQARQLGITVPILGADGFDSPTLLELAGPDALNNVYYTNHYSSLDEDPAVAEFIEAFKAEYGKEPDAFNALGYDLAKFAVDGVARASEQTPEAVKDALAATTNFKAVTGSFSIDEFHNPVKEIVVIELQEGLAASSVKVAS